MNTIRRVAAAIAIGLALTGATTTTADAAPTRAKYKMCGRIKVAPVTTTCGFARTVDVAVWLYGDEFRGAVYSDATRRWYPTRCHYGVCKTGTNGRVTVYTVSGW